MSVVTVKEEPGLTAGPSDESADAASQNRRKGSRRQGGGILSSAGMPAGASSSSSHVGFAIVVKSARVSDDLRGRVRDLVKSLMDCFVGSQWLDVAGLVCAMKRNNIRPDALPSIWRDYHKLTYTPPHHMSLFLESFRDIFESRTIYSAPVISRLVQAGVLSTPFGRIPNPPLLLYRLRPVAGKDPSGFLMTHPLNTWTSSRAGAAFVLPALPTTCSYCRPNGVWVGHAELAHSRAGDSSVSVEPHLHGGVPADAALLRVRRKRHDEWAALEEVRRKKLDEVEQRQRGVRVTGAVRPWQAGDYVVVRGADVPTANLCFVIGRDGFMIEALQDKLQVLLKVPYKGEREGDVSRIMVRGLPERVDVAVEYIEARFGDSMESVATKHNLWRKLERKYASLYTVHHHHHHTNSDGRVVPEVEEAKRHRLEMSGPPAAGTGFTDEAAALPPIKRSRLSIDEPAAATAAAVPRGLLSATMKARAGGAAAGSVCPKCGETGEVCCWRPFDGEVSRACIVCAPTDGEEVRDAPNGQLLTESEFIDEYGSRREWEAANLH